MMKSKQPLHPGVRADMQSARTEYQDLQSDNRKQYLRLAAIILALACLATPFVSMAQDNTETLSGTSTPKETPVDTAKVELLPDSSNLAIVSLLIASPGEEGFYALGHSALRLKSPVHNLDYCYSYNTIEEPGPLFNVLLLAGQMRAAYEPVPYETYMERYRNEQRGVTEYMLNLTLHEKQELWRLMDNQVKKGYTLPFDFMFNNCTSTIFRSVSSVMEKENFDYPQMEPLTLSTRDCFAHIYRQTPWLDFMGMTFLTAYAREQQPIDIMINPALWAQLLPKTDIVGLDGARRPALSEAPRTLLQNQLQVKPSTWTPTLVFAILLLVALLVTAAQWLLHWRRLPRALDAILFIAHALVSAYLLYASCTSMFGTFWNWMLLVFNLVPLLLWLVGRKKPWHRRVWLPYAAVILVTMVLLPILTGNPEIPHQLIFATLLTRCVSKHFEPRLMPAQQPKATKKP